MQTTEDADLALKGLAIVERDGFYEEGEMEGEIMPADLDAVDIDEEAAAIGGTWPGEVRQRLHPLIQSILHKTSVHVDLRSEIRCRNTYSLMNPSCSRRLFGLGFTAVPI